MFNRKRFEHLDHRLDKLELYFTIRDPGTAKSAEAYDGLRKSLIAAYKGTQNHMAHLAQLHRAARAADSIEPLIAKLDEFMQQIGVVEISDPSVVDLDPSHPSLTEVFDVTQRDGNQLVVDEPAYVSANDGNGYMVVTRGVAHFEESASDTEPSVAGNGQRETTDTMAEATAVADPDSQDSHDERDER